VGERTGDRRREPDEVYRRFAPGVLGYARAQGADEPEDLAADVFVQVVRDLPRFKGDDHALRRWVFTIAHHRLVDHHRQRRRRPRFVPADGVDVASPTLGGSDLVDPALLRALRQLTRRQRDVVLLRFVADLPIADVARLLRRRQGAIKALQHRALTSLSAELTGAPPTGRAPTSTSDKTRLDNG
jgi:RNA polymerase sigma-70 factor (ECF subfamily)